MRGMCSRTWWAAPCPSLRATSCGLRSRLSGHGTCNHFAPAGLLSGRIAPVMARWECVICGYIHEGAEPPDICPVCDAPKEFFRLL
ncbi:MAG TPA: hypothetical protein VK944_11310 [Candidatus Limnocylindria bacterium]|nr:hypothetical protein [Candidatus Limnocylindria bacterium]